MRYKAYQYGIFKPNYSIGIDILPYQFALGASIRTYGDSHLAARIYIGFLKFHGSMKLRTQWKGWCKLDLHRWGNWFNAIRIKPERDIGWAQERMCNRCGARQIRFVTKETFE